MLHLKDNPKLILSEMHMMTIFEPLRQELPPLQEYYDHLFKAKKTKLVNRVSGTKVMQMCRLREEVFHPRIKTNQDTNELVVNLNQNLVDAVLFQFRAEGAGKCAWKYISAWDGERSFKVLSAQGILLKHVKCVNDDAESGLAANTSNLNSTQHIQTSGACGDAQQGHLLDRPMSGKLKKEGVFFQWPVMVQMCMIIAAIADAPKIRDKNRSDIERQDKARLDKDKRLKAKRDKIDSNELANAIYYYDCYNTPSCWKGPPTIVRAKLDKIKDADRKWDALQHNIKIRWVGFGWTQFKIFWTKGKEKQTIRVLSEHLRTILRYENLSTTTIPTEAQAISTYHKNMKKYGGSYLGTITDTRRQILERHKDNDEVRRRWAKDVAKERAARKHPDGYYMAHQPWDAPTIAALVENEMRIDVLWPMRKGKMEWCQGQVIKRCQGRRVMVRWDALPDMPDFDKVTESEVPLLEEDYRQNKKWGWRLDMGVELFESYYNKDDGDVDRSDDDKVAILDVDDDEGASGDKNEGDALDNRAKNDEDSIQESSDEEWDE